MEDVRNNVGLGDNNSELEKLQVENMKLKHRLIILNRVGGVGPIDDCEVKV